MKNREKEFYSKPYGCSVQATLSVIGGRWKPVILFHLLDSDVLRFGQLKSKIESITQRMLTSQLRELEADGVIERKVYPEVPPKVEYRLTDYGLSLKPILVEMKEWGANHLRHINTINGE